jgi:hypothetical protein
MLHIQDTITDHLLLKLVTVQWDNNVEKACKMLYKNICRECLHMLTLIDGYKYDTPFYNERYKCFKFQCDEVNAHHCAINIAYNEMLDKSKNKLFSLNAYATFYEKRATIIKSYENKVLEIMTCRSNIDAKYLTDDDSDEKIDLLF